MCTCLADDPPNLETRSSTLRTPGTLSQTNNSIHKQTSKDAPVKHQIKEFDRRVQLKNSGSQRESNQTEQRNSNGERNKIRLLI